MIPTGFVVRITGICASRNNWGIVSEQVLAAKRFHEPLLNLMLGSSAVAYALADFLKSCRDNRIHAVARGEVSFDLFIGPRRFKLCHQVRGTDYVFSQPAQQFDRPGIDQRYGENNLVRR